jgi:hypothetical protein
MACILSKRNTRKRRKRKKSGCRIMKKYFRKKRERNLELLKEALTVQKLVVKVAYNKHYVYIHYCDKSIRKIHADMGDAKKILKCRLFYLLNQCNLVNLMHHLDFFCENGRVYSLLPNDLKVLLDRKAEKNMEKIEFYLQSQQRIQDIMINFK